MYQKIKDQVNELIKKYKLEAFKEVAVFAIITLAIHFVYNFWANRHFLLFGIHVIPREAFAWSATQVYFISKWVLFHIFMLKNSGVDETLTIYFPHKGFIEVVLGCSGLKQLIQFALLFLIYPGPWKHKLWYIPMGIVIVYIVNVFRIVGLGLLLQWNGTYFDLVHDYVFRPFFYVVIFALWVIWVEKFERKKKPEIENA